MRELPHPRRPIDRREFALRVAVILVAAMLFAVVLRGVLHGDRPAGGSPAADAILAGQHEQPATPTLGAEDAEDQNLQDDEAEAGRLWARDHPDAFGGECPSDPPAFHRGCVDAAARR